MKKGAVYIMTSKNNTVLYIGVTSDLKGRIKQHKDKTYKDSFTAKYNVNKLVYYEWYDTIGEAIKKEKLLKGGNRKKKIELINGMNPEWRDLEDDLQ